MGRKRSEENQNKTSKVVKQDANLSSIKTIRKTTRRMPQKVFTIFFHKSGTFVEKSSKRECETFIKGLGDSVVDIGVEMRIFDDREKYISFKNKNIHEKDKMSNIIDTQACIPSEKSTNDPSNLNTGVEVGDDTDDLPDFTLTEEPQKTNTNDTLNNDNAVSSPIALKFKKDLSKRGIYMVVHTFPTVPDNAKIQPVLIDFVDQKPWTHWCHRATTWRDVLQYALKEGIKTNKFLEKIRSIHGTTRNLNDTVETYTVKSSSGNNIKLQRQLLIGYIRNGLEDEEILNGIARFLTPLYTNKDIMECYYMSATSDTESKNMKQALDPNTTSGRDSYWKMLETFEFLVKVKRRM